MHYLVIFLLFINLSISYSNWEIDTFLHVPNSKVKIIKYNNSYFLLEKTLNNIELTEIEKYSKKIIDTNFYGSLLDIDIDTNYIIYNTYSGINYYKYKKEFTLLKLDAKVSEFIELKNDMTFSFSCYLASKDCKIKQRTYVQVYNKNEKSVKQIKFHEPKGIDLTGFLPIKEMTLFDTLIAVSEIIDYKIKFYNIEGHLLDSLSFKPSKWVQYSDTIPFYDCGPTINNFYQDCYYIIDNFSRLKLINSLNDSTLMVSWSTGYTIDNDTRFEYNQDIWVKKSNKWCIVESIDQTVKSKNKILDFDAMDLGDSYYVKNGYLYIIKPFPTNLVKEYYGKSKSDFENKMNEFYVDNDLQYTCFIYKYIP